MAKKAIKKTGRVTVGRVTKKASKKSAGAKKPAAKKSPSRAAKATKVPAKRSQSGARKPVVLETEVIVLPDASAEHMEQSPADAPAAGGLARPAGGFPGGSAAGFAVAAARLCRDDHCEDVVLLDVRGVSAVTDYIVIATGTSDRQMRSVQHHIEELGVSTGNPPARSSADDRATWLVADFVDVVVHLFEPGTRSHYDLEMLWGDAPRVAWERRDQLDRDRAGIAVR